MLKMNASRREIQTQVEHWTLDHGIKIGPGDPAFWALIELIDKREEKLCEKNRIAEGLAYQAGYDASQGLKA